MRGEFTQPITLFGQCGPFTKWPKRWTPRLADRTSPDPLTCVFTEIGLRPASSGGGVADRTDALVLFYFMHHHVLPRHQELLPKSGMWDVLWPRTDRWFDLHVRLPHSEHERRLIHLRQGWGEGGTRNLSLLSKKVLSAPSHFVNCSGGIYLSVRVKDMGQTFEKIIQN